VLVASHSTERFDAILDGRVTLERGLVRAASGSGVTSTPPTIPGGRRPTVVEVAR